MVAGKAIQMVAGLANPGGSLVDLTHNAYLTAVRNYDANGSITQSILSGEGYFWGSFVGARQINEGIQGVDFASGESLSGLNAAGRFSEGVSAAASAGAGGLELGGVDVPINGVSSAIPTAAEDFIGPTFGRSGFRTTGDFAQELGTQYQGFVDNAYAAAEQARAAGLLRPPPGISMETHMGQLVDQAARADLQGWVASEGIAEGPGQIVQINRYLRDPLGSGAYTIPDVRIPGANLILDGTIGVKTTSTPQVINFYNFSGGNNILIVRPTQLGGSSGMVFP